MAVTPDEAWDVRQHVTVSTVSPQYDAVVARCANRHANLIGDLPFSVLFNTPIQELAPRLLDRIVEASDPGLYDDANNLHSLGLSLVGTVGDMTLGDLARRPAAEFPQHTLRLLSKIKAAGIEIPVPTSDDQLRSRRASALDALLSDAPAATYKSLFTSEHRNASSELHAAVRQARATDVLGGAKPPPPPPPPPPPQVTLANCTVSFHTNNEDKDSDTHVTIRVRDDNNVTAAFISNNFGHFDDNSDSGPFGLEIQNASTIESLQRGTVTIRVDPNGHDTWRFNLSLLSLLFSDGRRLSGSADGIELTQDRREQSFGISGLLKQP
jgi:hypothetical protein